MEVNIEPHSPNWKQTFDTIHFELLKTLQSFNPTIEHIGSTSIEGLSAKPIIDIMIGIPDILNLDGTIQPLINQGYIYFEKFNSVMPKRRFYAKLKSVQPPFKTPSIYTESDIIPNEINDYKLAHIHIFELNSLDFKRHIAFREFLKENPKIKEEYQNLKLELSTKKWKDGSEYNAAKNDFIKLHEAEAIKWYTN